MHLMNFSNPAKIKIKNLEAHLPIWITLKSIMLNEKIQVAEMTYNKIPFL